MLENKIVHLPTIHGKTLKPHQSSFNSPTVNFLLQKEIVLLTIRHHQFYWGKNPLFPSMLPTFIQKGKNGWAAQSDLWASQPLVFPTPHFQQAFTKIIKLLQSRPILYEEGPA